MVVSARHRLTDRNRHRPYRTSESSRRSCQRPNALIARHFPTGQIGSCNARWFHAAQRSTTQQIPAQPERYARPANNTNELVLSRWWMRSKNHSSLSAPPLPLSTRRRRQSSSASRPATPRWTLSLVQVARSATSQQRVDSHRRESARSLAIRSDGSGDLPPIGLQTPGDWPGHACYVARLEPSKMGSS